MADKPTAAPNEPKSTSGSGGDNSGSPAPARRKAKGDGPRGGKKPAATKKKTASQAKFPRHSVEQALRVPRAILEQNAGHGTSTKDAAGFVGLKAHGPFRVEVSSAKKYGLLETDGASLIKPSDLAKKILRPQKEGDDIEGYREAVMRAPDIAEVYQHYRGENLPDTQFLKNTVVDTYKVPAEKFQEFKTVFLESLKSAELVEEHDGKVRVLDVTERTPTIDEPSDRIKKLGRSVKVEATDTCFVMQPFASPLGDYYDKIYKPAIEKAGLVPVRADADIFGTGKIMDQVWRGINAAKVLVAELTTRNPNVFYELGMAHALEKPVVLISSNENDVPFDLQHIRVIYYDVTDPFWGQKLIEKVAENVLSAIRNPEEAVFSVSKGR